VPAAWLGEIGAAADSRIIDTTAGSARSVLMSSSRLDAGVARSTIAAPFANGYLAELRKLAARADMVAIGSPTHSARMAQRAPSDARVRPKA
jgi:hypothetical protein